MYVWCYLHLIWAFLLMYFFSKSLNHLFIFLIIFKLICGIFFVWVLVDTDGHFTYKAIVNTNALSNL